MGDLVANQDSQSTDRERCGTKEREISMPRDLEGFTTESGFAL